MLEVVAVRVVVMSPSMRLSSTPVMVMVWAVFQFAFAKVRVSVSRRFSVASWPVMETVTLAVGCASRTTVNVEELPASVVRRSAPSVVPVWVMVMPFGLIFELLVTGLFVMEAASLPWIP